MLSSSAKIFRSSPLQRCLAKSAQPLSASPASFTRPSPSIGGQERNSQLRWKHSSTQLKRIFLQHPARARMEERLGVDRTPLPLSPPKFDAVFQFEMLPNGWSAPPGPGVQVPTYPFKIARTKNKPNDAAGFLPVYTKMRKDGTKTTTRIRKVTGDAEAFLNELRSVLQLPAPRSGNPRDDAIRTRVGGTIEIEGNHVRQVKEWLAGLGF